MCATGKCTDVACLLLLSLAGGILGFVVCTVFGSRCLGGGGGGLVVFDLGLGVWASGFWGLGLGV